MLLAAWLHDIGPFVFRISGDFGIRWYGVAYIAAFAIAYFLLRRMAKGGMTLIPYEHVGDAMVAAVLGVMLGGRLGYVFLYQPDLLWDFSSAPPWWGVLAINKGGMASHGGIAGVILSAFRISRGWKRPDGTRVGIAPTRHVLDTLALVTPFGLMLGRIANFINGELLGKIVALPGEPAPQWAVKFPQEVLTEHDPARLMDPDGATERMVALERLAGAGGREFVPAYERVLERLHHGDQGVAQQLAPLISARHPSQLYQAFAEGIVLAAVLWLVARRPRLPGVVGCWFMITYGVLRILTEVWRLPDEHLRVARPLGLSRGQWFSLAMVVAGVVILRLIIVKGGPKLGGWDRGAGEAAGAGGGT